jgi:hypothetical protein
MDVVEGETANCSGTGETCDDGTKEFSMKVEDTIDIKEEFSITVEDTVDIKEEFSTTIEDTIDIKEEFSTTVKDTVDIKDEVPEAVTLTSVNPEQEVRLWGVCVWLWQLVLLGHLLSESTSFRLCSNTTII